MATDPITVNDGAADKDYQLMSAKGNEFLYRDDVTTLAEPGILRIAYTEAKSSTGIDRHLVSFNVKVCDDDEDETPYVGGVHIVIANPRKVITDAEMLKEWTKLKNFVTSSWADLLAGLAP